MEKNQNNAMITNFYCYCVQILNSTSKKYSVYLNKLQKPNAENLSWWCWKEIQKRSAQTLNVALHPPTLKRV